MAQTKRKLLIIVVGPFILLLTVAWSFPSVATAQMQQWQQEERMRQICQQQQWSEYQQQERMRQMYDRQQWLQWQQEEKLRQMCQKQVPAQCR
jgi:hypothetical protein